MNKTIWAMLVLALAPCSARGQALMEMVRSKGFDVPAAGAGAPVTLADYRSVQNPDFVDPNKEPAPPNLTQQHINRLIDLMATAEVANRADLKRLPPKKQEEALTLTKEDVIRLGGMLSIIDRNYVDNIPAAVWDKVIEDMGKVATESFRFKNGKGNWHATVNKMINAVAEKILDPFSEYWTKEEYVRFQREMKNTFVGVGVILKEDGTVNIVIPRSPAEKAGLKAGDKIVAVNGRPVSDRGQVSRLTQGKAGTAVRLTVLRGGSRLQVTAVRGEVKTKNVYSKMAAPGVGYVYLGQFGDDCDTELLAAVADLRDKGAEKLVIDVRGNPGGTVSSVSQIASEFFRHGQKIVSFKKKGQVMSENVTEGDGEFLDMPVAILVNGGSASASEILAGALQDVRGPVVVGSRSYGKGTMQHVIPELKGGALKLTEGRWYTPRDRSIDAQHDKKGDKIKGTGGIVPDYVVDLSEEQERAIMGQLFREVQGAAPQGARVPDPVMEKAMEVLGK